MRKLGFLLAGLCALSVVVWSVDDAAARGRGGGHGHGARMGHSGHHGSFFRGGGSAFRHHHHRHVGVRFAPYYATYNSCYRWRYVRTPYGPQLRRVYVCGYRYGLYPYRW